MERERERARERESERARERESERARERESERRVWAYLCGAAAAADVRAGEHPGEKTSGPTSCRGGKALRAPGV